MAPRDRRECSQASIPAGSGRPKTSPTRPCFWRASRPAGSLDRSSLSMAVASRTDQDALMAERLELQNGSKRFGGVAAVEPLTLTVEPGALLALLGPSGCGKTTTLRIIAGFERPDSGAVKVDRRRLGMVFQNYSLFPHMTVGQNIAFG